MREIIELADGNIYAVEIDSLRTFDKNEQDYYSWLNSVEYLGEGEFIELTKEELLKVDPSKIIREDG